MEKKKCHGCGGFELLNSVLQPTSHVFSQILSLLVQEDMFKLGCSDVRPTDVF